MERIPVNPSKIDRKDVYSFAQVSLDEDTNFKNNRLFYNDQQETLNTEKAEKKNAAPRQSVTLATAAEDML